MSENTSAGRADALRRRCRRTRPEAYRCACGRLRDRCVRAAVRALWSPTRRAAHGGTAHPDAPRGSGATTAAARTGTPARLTPADPTRP
ncbi:hypothetical protein ACIBVK_29405 [Micromonospora echinofusca]|uniref:hypothetical protein n=1 Tax=Micromonospora echinofusca TaxID=47858 RepID=UPI000CA7F893